jgi:aspartate aminotransferase-like enzyme
MPCYDGLKARGFVIYEGQGRLAREIFRVANMGHLDRADFRPLLAALAGARRVTAILLAAGSGSASSASRTAARSA